MHTDYIPYFDYTTRSRFDKAIKSLVGIIEGIAIDEVINSRELSFLAEWIGQNDDLKNRHPFNELIPVVQAAFQDYILTEDGKQDVLWLCQKLTSHTSFYDQVTNDIQKLHGILGGIIADGVITEKELIGLREWLIQHEHLRTCWPYDEIDSIVTSVMADKKINEEENKILTAVFSDFLSFYDDRVITSPPILEASQISGICAVCPEIQFKNSTFCFTGTSSRHKRQELEKLVVRLGGKFTKNVSKSLNYLVIGAEGNPCWTYACYGRKVEAAINLRKEGHRLLLVHENDFHDAVADFVGG